MCFNYGINHVDYDATSTTTAVATTTSTTTTTTTTTITTNNNSVINYITTHRLRVYLSDYRSGRKVLNEGLGVENPTG